ncbi:hypothetical protein [Mesorhizobium sp. LSJC255A00]|uniref:hypothetical protein n=1 Tax=Mesorhizobium sp. LSJC255A00 TaxID=1287313 RepID=UPI00040D45E2|nr:hypothetical protein [Mesorhizobium sp. LSJC255A00]
MQIPTINPTPFRSKTGRDWFHWNTHIIDENGRKLSSEKAESTPDAIADPLPRHGPIERAVIETGRMSPAICLGLRKLGVNVV